MMRMPFLKHKRKIILALSFGLFFAPILCHCVPLEAATADKDMSCCHHQTQSSSLEINQEMFSHHDVNSSNQPLSCDCHQYAKDQMVKEESIQQNSSDSSFNRNSSTCVVMMTTSLSKNNLVSSYQLLLNRGDAFLFPDLYLLHQSYRL